MYLYFGMNDLTRGSVRVLDRNREFCDARAMFNSSRSTQNDLYRETRFTCDVRTKRDYGKIKDIHHAAITFPMTTIELDPRQCLEDL